MKIFSQPVLCHILAFVFQNKFREIGFRAFHIVPASGLRGSHVFVSNGSIAFDWQGLRPEQALIEEYFASFKNHNADWDAQVRLIKDDETCESFCKAHQHRLPEQFYQDPRPRALSFIERKLSVSGPMLANFRLL